MIQAISIGDNMLSLWSSRTSCNVLWWIRLFRRDISPKKIVKLITSISHMKRGRFKTKRYLFGSNQHFQSPFYHECLDRSKPMKFGRRFMSTSVFRWSLVHANYELCKIKGFVYELAGVGVLVRHEEYTYALLEGFPSDYAPVVSVIESEKHTSSIVKIRTLLYGYEIRLVRYKVLVLLQ